MVIGNTSNDKISIERRCAIFIAMIFTYPGFYRYLPDFPGFYLVFTTYRGKQVFPGKKPTLIDQSEHTLNHLLSLHIQH